MKRAPLRWLFLLAVSLTVASAALAQDTASITGTVTDQTGAAIPGANVTVVSPDHGISRSAKTNGSGDYLFAVLPIGRYDVQVEAAGFKKYQFEGPCASDSPECTQQCDARDRSGNHRGHCSGLIALRRWILNLPNSEAQSLARKLANSNSMGEISRNWWL